MIQKNVEIKGIIILISVRKLLDGILRDRTLRKYVYDDENYLK